MLADDAAGARVRWGTPPRVRALVDTLTYPGATTVDIEPRANRQGGFSIAVGTQHTSLGQTLIDCITEVYEKSGLKGTVTFTETGGAQSLYEITIAEVGVLMQIGIYVVTEYQFTGGHL